MSGAIEARCEAKLSYGCVVGVGATARASGVIPQGALCDPVPGGHCPHHLRRLDCLLFIRWTSPRPSLWRGFLYAQPQEDAGHAPVERTR